MKIKFLQFIPKMFLIWLLVAACEKDPAPDIAVGAEGYFIVNEGGFNNSNTSISYYYRDKDSVANDIFTIKNSRPLGDQSQGLTVFEGKAYIAVQNSAKVEVIDAHDFSSIKTITEDIESPRYFLGISSSKAYLSDWGADGLTGTVKVIDLEQMKVVKTIPTGMGANKMLLRDGKVYVANNGGYGLDNKISIIDIAADSVTSTITVGDNPNSLVFDKDGNLWVAGIGNYFDTNPWIGKVGTDNQQAFKLDFAELTYEMPSIATNKAGDLVYYNYNGFVYAMSTSATTLPATGLITKSFYGLAVDPITDEIIGTETNGFSAAGKIYIYNAAGTLRRSFDVGIAPNGIGFK